MSLEALDTQLVVSCQAGRADVDTFARNILLAFE